MNFFGHHLVLLSNAQMTALKDAGHEIENYAASETQKAVAFLKTTDIGKAVTTAFDDITTSGLSGVQKMEKVVADAMPLVASFAAEGGIPAIVASAESLTKELCQSLWNDLKSTSAGEVAAAALRAGEKLLGLEAEDAKTAAA